MKRGRVQWTMSDGHADLLRILMDIPNIVILILISEYFTLKTILVLKKSLHGNGITDNGHMTDGNFVISNIYIRYQSFRSLWEWQKRQTITQQSTKQKIENWLGYICLCQHEFGSSE